MFDMCVLSFILSLFNCGTAFFTDKEQKDIGGGIVLWRGYFQYVYNNNGRRNSALTLRLQDPSDLGAIKCGLT